MSNHMLLVVRVWFEQEGDTLPPSQEHWRASVRDTSTGIQRYFSEPQRLQDFLSSILRVDPRP
ncbi:hypothetical protein [Deinococcus cellulosilyticus]|uniref:Uncharacterized protein n=1 Tax=Deinococcus cellulosilyticus (strain DSM 18568 / NBRC 106333 / KACC 11606 / 5516J-15) TaxID=1223518 RepID=A0A511MYU3_DEIC1|nr:hypothetical protein [Deinococcus cellulosilyticus]GEM45692.1 hypothetical protein DC3_13270 [Deinococcus cellulosilyticus NBRC 106333 = KACC 11606]